MMAGDGSLWMFILFKGFLGFVVPIGLGVHQLVSVRRLIRADREAAAAAPTGEGAPSPEPAERETRERELEPA
jgi:hypothetical protein